MPHQVTNITYDKDSGILNLRLLSGEEYKILNAGHAKTIMAKVTVGGMISDDQKKWLEPYRAKHEPKALRERLAGIYKALKGEFKPKGER